MPFQQGKITVVPLRMHDGRVQYWCSSRQEAPYLVGQRFIDWSGPYSSKKVAISQAARFHPCHSEIVPLDRTLDWIEEAQFFWPDVVHTFQLRFWLPLDEFTERLCLAEPLSDELNALRDEVLVRVEANPSEGASDFWVKEVAPLNGVFKERRIDEAGACFAFPVRLTFCMEQPLPAGELLSYSVPKVSMPQLYPGELKAFLSR